MKVPVAALIGKIRGLQLIVHVKALPGRPYDGHTLATVLPEIERLTGVPLWRMPVDREYRGHNAAPKHEPKVFVSGQRRNTMPAIRKQLRRRNAVEPVIGHVRNEHRMGRNHLAGSEGDAMNAVPAAAGYNFHLLSRWAEAFLRLFSERLPPVDYYRLACRLSDSDVSFSQPSQIPRFTVDQVMPRWNQSWQRSR